jgi:hypothetical protein
VRGRLPALVVSGFRAGAARLGSGVLRLCLAEDGVIWPTSRVGFGFVALMDSITDYGPLVKEIYSLFPPLKTLYYGQLALCKIGRSC